jgi:hypothetical protein
MPSRAVPVFVAVAMIACGSSTANAPKSSPSTESSNPEEPSPADTAAARAGWDRLVKEEAVWQRPDLDASCDKTRSGHYMAAVGAFEDRVVLASNLGCKPITFVLPGSDGSPGSSFPGGDYCCPRDLPRAPMPHTGGGKSCEQAQKEYIDAAPHEGDKSKQPTAGTYGAILNRGSYFKHCSVPDTTTIQICTAIQNGRAVGITVRTQPVDPGPADCIAEAVLKLSFPENPRMDVTKTSF